MRDLTSDYSRADRELIDLARRLATELHQDSKPYGDQPYIVHPAAVAELLEPYGPEAVALGWLHDTVEDTEATIEWLRFEGIPENVLAGIDAVTRRPGETYFDFVRRAAQHDLGRIGKLADNFANSRNLDTMADRLRAAGLSRRYRRARQILERTHVAITARLAGLEPTNRIWLSDLDMGESDYWFFALGHHAPELALAAFLERAREMKWGAEEMPPATTEDITQGWAIWTGTRTDWAFLPVPDNTTPGAFRATWLSGL